MATTVEQPTEQRLLEVLQHLGLQRVHVAARTVGDWQGLVTASPQTLASLILVCPQGIDPGSLTAVASRLCVLSGAQGRPADNLRQLMHRLAGAKLTVLSGYDSPSPYADIAADGPTALAVALEDFLARPHQPEAPAAVSLPEGEGEVAGITYRVRGAGAPLVLLPLSVAPSQWEPILPRLCARYCTITLSGPELGMVASLERRGHTDGYLRVVGNLLDAAHVQAGEVILEVGCGTGVLDRWMARRTKGANRIVAMDVNRFLLQEAAALARKDGVDHLIEFREGSAESLPFPDNSVDVAMASTVIQRTNADRMLTEMTRVVKPGGRVAIVGHAHDMPQWVNLPLRADLKARIEAPGWHDTGSHAQGCDESSLYRRMHQAGLADIKMFPQFAAFDEAPRLQQLQATILPTLSPADTQDWHAAMAQATAAGTFFIATPFHCAVGTKRAGAA